MQLIHGEPHLFDPGPDTGLTVTSIRVEHLYGKYSYDLDVAPIEASPGAAATGDLITINEERLTLLYGRNGSGKTTLLRMLFHALSAADDRGHRTALFGIPFQRLDINLSDHSRLSYHRPPETPIGAYTAELDRAGDDAPPIAWHYTEPGRPGNTLKNVNAWVQLGAFDEAQLYPQPPDDDESRFILAMQNLAINPVFLGDSRAITADALEREDIRARDAAGRVTGHRALDMDEIVQISRNIDVHDALERVRRYLSQLAFTGTQEGSQRVDNVYLNVSGAIIQAASTVGRPNKSLLPSLVKKMADLGKRADRFYEYGLLPEFPVAPLMDAISNAPDRQGPLLKRVLDPYLDGMTERMDALEPGLRAVASFIDALNSFLEGKRAEFRPSREGVRIIDQQTQEPLDVSVLSSGEKQIVLLFSDITALQRQTRLFIIDEPELSLNPEWQRSLMPRLLGVTEQTGMQLIAATHSIEIMAKYRARIRRLDD